MKHCHLLLAFGIVILFHSGFALNCIECKGDEKKCVGNDKGISTACPSDTIACINSTVNGITRQCGQPNLPPHLKLNECAAVNVFGEEGIACACNSNDCNKGGISKSPQPPSGGLVGVIGLVIATIYKQQLIDIC